MFMRSRAVTVLSASMRPILPDTKVYISRKRSLLNGGNGSRAVFGQP
jgi:hypothetical protein